MKKILTIALLLFSIGLIAQAPVNDDCDGILELGEAPYCPDTVFFSNVDATPSDIGNDNIPDINTCSGLGPMENDVWFSFVAVDTIQDYSITVTGLTDGMGSTPMLQPQVAVYRGDICGIDELELLDCAAAELGESSIELCLSGLDAGLTYFVRVTDYSETAAPNEGTFQLCIKKKDPIIIIGDTEFTALCTGEVYDSGGPDGDYGANENFVLTIQPPAPTECITFTLNYYNFEEFSDGITFYDGPNTSSPVIADLSGGNGNGGGVCYVVNATSGALTLEFTSDGTVNLEGFYGAWECSSSPCEPANEQIVVDVDNIDGQTIVDNISTPLTQVTVTNIDCANGAYGTFEAGDNTDLGLERGLVMTSGSAAETANPATFFASNGNGLPGDPELDYLSNQSGNPSASNDACVIEVEVFVATDELRFEYVFGSEEYPNFINTPTFNDIFAFLISGPGITGDPNINNQQNIAILPDPAAGTPVEVFSVNQNTNWEFYRNNLLGQSVAYGGLTSDFQGVKKSLTAIQEVTPCETYNIKFAIADRGDGIYDSGVFISELQGGVPILEAEFTNGIQYLVEECVDNPDNIVIGLSSPQEDTTSYTVLIEGTATPGVDYTINIPGQIVFPPGVTEFSFPISAITDGVPEGVETIQITLTNDFGCGEVVFSTLTIELYDQLAVEIFAGADTAFVCAGSELQMEVQGALDYIWSPASVFEDQIVNIPDPVAQPTEDGNVFVVGFLGPCVAVDTVFLDVVDPEMNISTGDPTGICQGDSVLIFGLNNVGNSNLEWTSTPFFAFDDPTDPEQVVDPLVPTSFFASVEVAGCEATDTIFVDVDPFDFPEVANDTMICENYSVQLAEPLFFTSTTFEWTPTNGIMPGDETLSGPVATPDQTTTYILTATSANAYCDQVDSITVMVTPADVEIVSPDVDTVEICLGEQVDITSITTTPGTGLIWTPDDGTLTSQTDESVIATPSVSTNYIATLQVGACTVFDSIFVRVDSLPESALEELIPEKETYCEGELITFVFPTYEPANFPDIQHQWSPDTGIQSPDSLWNLVISAVETTTYFRITTNNACSDTVAVPIEVVPTAMVSVTPDMSEVCQGEQIQLLVTSDLSYDSLTWSAASGNLDPLSCDDCPDPIVTATQNDTYTVEAEFDGCPVSASATVEVLPIPQYEFPDPASICPGETIPLNVNGNPDQDATYSWFEDGSLISQDFNPTVGPDVTTTYVLEIDKPGCTQIIDSVTIFVFNSIPTLQIVPADTLICIGESVTLSASALLDGIPASGTFTWSTGDVGETITVTPSITTQYNVTFDASCISIEDSTLVNVSQGFTIDSIVTTPPDMVFEGSEITLEAFTTPADLFDPEYFWTQDQSLADGGLIVGQTNPAIVVAPSVEDDEIVQYFLTIIDELGCGAEGLIDILVKESNYMIPNAFVPGSEQEDNRRFNVIRNEAVIVKDFKIFNRWGQLVYDNDDNENGWDGTQDGSPAPSDVYAYYVVLELGDGEEVVENGDVTLIR
jgi:gliding motility-associated-like protein